MKVNRKRKVLRRGYTTGTCASAAAKGAVSILYGGAPDRIVVDLPIGGEAEIRPSYIAVKDGEAVCCVIKDAGDDPDVTHGAKICARARKIDRGIKLRGGVGVGVVTKPGLKVGVGQPAINPVPRRMIINEVKKVLPPGEGVEVTIFVPEGEELARRTMNKKLGIVGGISIIGTTGIVEPWSKEALRDSLIPQLDVALAQGYDEVVLTPGRIGERTAIEKGVPEDAIIQMGNFVGDMLMECVKRGIKKAVLFGHVGKLTKVAAGFFNTHSKVSAPALEVIARHASLHDIRREVVDSLLEANTAEHAVEILGGEGALVVFDSLAEEAARRAESYVDGKMKISTAFVSLKGEVVGKYNLEASKWGKYLS